MKTKIISRASAVAGGRGRRSRAPLSEVAMGYTLTREAIDNALYRKFRMEAAFIGWVEESY